MRSKQRATMSRWLTAVIVYSVAGCSDADANHLSLSVGGVRNDSAVTSARVTYPGFVRNFEDYGRQGPLTIPIHARFGTIQVQFARVKGAADTIGKGQVSLKITRGNVYGASFIREFPNTPYGCFGCSGDLKFPMTGSASASTDSMRIYYTNSVPLCKGCVTQLGDSVVRVARRE